MNQDLYTIGTDAVGFLSCEYVSGMIFEAVYTDPSGGGVNTFQLATAAHSVFAFNKIQSDPFSQSLQTRTTAGNVGALAPINKSINIRPSPSVLESFVRPLSMNRNGTNRTVEEPKPGFFDGILNKATNFMKNMDLSDTMEIAKFAFDAAALLVPNEEHGYVNRNTELQRL